jgi:hypothetical protein
MNKILVSLLAFGGILSATPVQVKYLNPGTPPVAHNGVYVGPYTLSINGVSTPAMCMDDFLEVYNGDHWAANVTAVKSSNLSSTYLGSGDLGSTSRKIFGQNYTSNQVYTAEAYLFSLLTKPDADRVNIQEAAWAIMDASTMTSIVKSKNLAVESYVQMAFNNLSFDAQYFRIISQTGLYSGNSKQEFMVVSTPEPASIALFGSGIFAVGLAGFIRRRKPEGAA